MWGSEWFLVDYFGGADLLEITEYIWRETGTLFEKRLFPLCSLYFQKCTMLTMGYLKVGGGGRREGYSLVIIIPKGYLRNRLQLRSLQSEKTQGRSPSWILNLQFLKIFWRSNGGGREGSLSQTLVLKPRVSNVGSASGHIYQKPRGWVSFTTSGLSGALPSPFSHWTFNRLLSSAVKWKYAFLTEAWKGFTIVYKST